jgi:DNA-binding transcriptional regulator GbsR (MarR family)
MEVEVIDLFVNVVKLLGMPKSVGEIYGLLFISPEPLALDGIVDRLRISKGSASQGLKFLRSVGAVATTYVAGDRRDHFLAEIRLKKLAAGFIREELDPHLGSGEHRLARLRKSISETSRDESSAPLVEFYEQQVDQLERWHTKARRVLPIIARFLG